MSIRLKWTISVVISMITVLLINNLFISFELTGFHLSLYRNPLIIILTIATMLLLSWIVYLLTGMYVDRINQIRSVLGKIQNHERVYFPKITKDEIGRTMNEIEQLSITLMRKDEKLQQQQRELIQLAYTDRLTGLPNRGQIMAIVDSKEQEGEELLILSIVLTRTDRVHALRGPGVFDGIILEAKDRIQSYLPSNAIIGRMGTNQFCVMLPIKESLDREGIIDKGISLQKVLEWPYYIEEDRYYINSYIGVSIRKQEEGMSLSELIHLSDLAVIERKEEIAPNIYLFHHLIRNEQEKLHSLEVALRAAIRNRELQVMYQPIVSLDSHTLAIETLVRWNYGEKWVSPAEFIPLVEELGLMEDMTLHVAEQAARDWRAWKERLPELSHVSINLSASLLKQGIGERILSSLVQIFNRYGLRPSEVCLEITEDVFLDESTTRFIDRSNQLGFILAVDDFGTGYSSMSYLASYSFDVLKIDRAFIIKIEFESKQREVAHSIIQLAKRLGIRVVAEGVETEEQLSILHEMGVNAIQGYYFGKPQFINEWNPKMLEERRKPLMPAI